MAYLSDRLDPFVTSGVLDHYANVKNIGEQKKNTGVLESDASLCFQVQTKTDPQGFSWTINFFVFKLGIFIRIDLDQAVSSDAEAPLQKFKIEDTEAPIICSAVGVISLFAPNPVQQRRERNFVYLQRDHTLVQLHFCEHFTTQTPSVRTGSVYWSTLEPLVMQDSIHFEVDLRALHFVRVN